MFVCSSGYLISLFFCVLERGGGGGRVGGGGGEGLNVK